MKFDFETENKKLIKDFEKEILLLNKKQDLILELDNYKPKQVQIKEETNKSEATAVLVASDWHFEEKVSRESVNNKNYYNLNTAEHSAINFFANGLRLVNILNKDIAIKNVVLALLGDFISGYIHDELMEENQLSPTESILKVYDVISSGIDFLLKNSKYKFIVICKYGNHGRTTQKPRIQSAHKNSYEWLLYHFLAKQYKDNKRVEFIVEDSYHTILNIYNYKLRFHHGDWLKYQGGIGGITVPANKAIGQWNRAEQVYLDVFGHWHTFFDGGNFICNGSLIGYNAFSINIKANYEEPKQTLFLIDKKRGKTIVAPIFVR